MKRMKIKHYGKSNQWQIKHATEVIWKVHFRKKHLPTPLIQDTKLNSNPPPRRLESSRCNCTGHKFTFRSSLGFSSFLHNYKVTLLTRSISLTSYRSLLHKEQVCYHTDGTFSRNLLSSHGCYLLRFRHQSLSTRNTKQKKPQLFTL